MDDQNQQSDSVAEEMPQSQNPVQSSFGVPPQATNTSGFQPMNPSVGEGAPSVNDQEEVLPSSETSFPVHEQGNTETNQGENTGSSF